MTTVRFKVMQALCEAGPSGLNQKQLQAECAATSGAVSTVLTALIADKAIAKHADDKDVSRNARMVALRGVTADDNLRRGQVSPTKASPPPSAEAGAQEAHEEGREESAKEGAPHACHHPGAHGPERVPVRHLS